MTKLRSIIAAIILAPLATLAGPEPAPVPHKAITIQSLATNIFEARAASFVISPALLGSKIGVGVAVLYPVGEYAFAGARIDLLDGNYTAPSAIIGAKYTVKNFPIPFVKDVTFISYGGLYMPLGGAEEKNHEVAGVTGIGASATLWKINDNFALSGAIAAEKLTSESSLIIRPAALLTWSFY